MVHRYFKVYIGTYAPEFEEGIKTYIFDREDGKMTYRSGLTGIENPSFLTLDLEHNLGYAVSEKEEGELVSFKINGNELDIVNKVHTHGSSPCYVEKNENFLFTVNYMGGNISTYPILENGEIGEAVDTIMYEGSSVDSERQESSHPHTIVKDPLSPYLFVTNLGTDHIHLLKQNEETGKFIEAASVKTKPGMGPRHIAFHPNEPFVYVSGELDGTIAIYRWNREQSDLKHINTISTLPSDFNEENTVAEIKVTRSGKTLYCSNRGHDSLAVFKIEEDGQLNLLQHASTEGSGPRHFTILPTEDYLFVGNQYSDNVHVFKLDHEGRLIEKRDSISVKSPVCLQVAPFEL